MDKWIRIGLVVLPLALLACGSSGRPLHGADVTDGRGVTDVASGDGEAKRLDAPGGDVTDSVWPDGAGDDAVAPLDLVDELPPEIVEPTDEAWLALKEGYPEVADDLMTSATLADGLSDAEVEGIWALIEVLDGLSDEERALAMPYLLSTPASCRSDLDIAIDAEFGDWPDDAWIDSVTTSGGIMGDFNAMAAATDGQRLYLAFDIDPTLVGETILSVDMDVAWGAFPDFGVAVRLDQTLDYPYFWHIREDGSTESRNSTGIEFARQGSMVELSVPLEALVPTDYDAIRLSPYIYSGETEAYTAAREFFILTDAVPGALEDLLVLLAANPGGTKDPTAAVAIAIEDRVWTYRPGDVALETIRADSTAMLSFALDLPAWLESVGLPDHFSGLGLRHKLHWAWRSGTGVSVGAVPNAPRWWRGRMTDELYEFWTIDVEDLAWYRDLLMEGGLPWDAGHTEALARAADGFIWESLLYTTAPEGFEEQCQLGMWDDDFCSNYESLLYSEGLVLGEVAGVELELWTAGSPDFQQQVYADKGHFVGDCGTQTSLMRAVLRALGLPAAFGRYDKHEAGIGPAHVYPVVYVQEADYWVVPQSGDYLLKWQDEAADAWFFFPARYGFAYPSYIDAAPGATGANFVHLDAATFGDVVALHETGVSSEFMDGFLSDEVLPSGDGDCAGGSSGAYLPFAIHWEPLLMGDGTALETVIYLPVSEGPHPVVLHRSMYGWNQATVERFLGQGYAFVAQWVRGRGGSAGELCLFGCDVDDGIVTVNWLLEQDWCDGHLATVGHGYAAFTALAAATHPEVDGVVAVNEPGLDIYTGWPGTPGRLLGTHFTAWLSFLANGIWPDLPTWVALINQIPVSGAADVVGADELPFLSDYLVHFQDGPKSAWRVQHGLTEQLDTLCAPVLHIRSRDWPYDGVESNGRTLEDKACKGTAGPQFLLSGMANTTGWFFGWDGEVDAHSDGRIDAYLTAVLGGQAPDGPDVDWFDGENWQTSSGTSEDWTLHLQVDGEWGGKLVEKAPDVGASSGMDNDPIAVVDSCADQFNALWFSSDALDAERSIVGPVSFQLTIAVDTLDADVILTLYEKTSADEYTRITMGGTRLSYRNGGEYSGSMPQGGQVTIAGTLTDVAYRLRKGSTVVLGLAPQGCWYHDNPNSGQSVGFETQVKPGTLAVYGGAGAASQVVLPLETL